MAPRTVIEERSPDASFCLIFVWGPAAPDPKVQRPSADVTALTTAGGEMPEMLSAMSHVCAALWLTWVSLTMAIKIIMLITQVSPTGPDQQWHPCNKRWHFLSVSLFCLSLIPVFPPSPLLWKPLFVGVVLNTLLTACCLCPDWRENLFLTVTCFFTRPPARDLSSPILWNRNAPVSDAWTACEAKVSPRSGSFSCCSNNTPSGRNDDRRIFFLIIIVLY